MGRVLGRNGSRGKVGRGLAKTTCCRCVRALSFYSGCDTGCSHYNLIRYHICEFGCASLLVLAASYMSTKPCLILAHFLTVCVTQIVASTICHSHCLEMFPLTEKPPPTTPFLFIFNIFWTVFVFPEMNTPGISEAGQSAEKWFAARERFWFGQNNSTGWNQVDHFRCHLFFLSLKSREQVVSWSTCCCTIRFTHIHINRNHFPWPPQARPCCPQVGVSQGLIVIVSTSEGLPPTPIQPLQATELPPEPPGGLRRHQPAADEPF